MDFRDEIKSLGERVIKMKEQLGTEEATKTAIIMPFIKSLGYDVFNPLEVVPEFISDIGIKKGEKIDYAIFMDGIPTILVECKHWNQNLDIHDGQLLRYFHVSKAKFSLLTNGIEYRFYSDLENPNIMDSKPFLEFNITDMKDSQIEELKKFHKSYFNVENIVNSASELKYLIQLKHLLHSELNNPSADFVNHFTKQVYQGRVTAKISEQFTALTKLAINQHISDIITERLKTALKQEDESLQINNNAVEIKPEDTNKINTTDEEKEAFMIIKSILRQKIDSKRIVYRDAQSYFAVLLDDNNRKTICRLYLGENKKYIAIIDSDKKEIKTEINSLDEIFNFGNSLIEKVIFYDSSKELN
jgi:hypothetical protein